MRGTSSFFALSFFFSSSIGSYFCWCLVLFILCSDLNLFNLLVSFVCSPYAHFFPSLPVVPIFEFHCVLDLSLIFFPFSAFFRCCLFLYHSVCIIVPLASSYGVFWWHKLFKSYDNKCPEKIAWHAKCIFSIFLTNDIVKTKRCAEVLLMLLELNKVEIFIGHDLFGYSGRHVLHYVNAMINLL